MRGLFTADKLGIEPIAIIKIDSVFYASKKLGEGTGDSVNNAAGKLIDIGDISFELDSINQAHKNSCSITLFGKFTFNYKTPIEVYQAYVNNNLVTSTLAFKGELLAPCTWSEENNTTSFTIENKYSEEKVGYDLNPDDYTENPPSLDNNGLPIVFGRVRHLEAVRVTHLLKGTTNEPIKAKDLEGTSGTYGSCTIQVENGKFFPQDEEKDYIIGGLKFAGTMSGDILTVNGPLLPRFTDIMISIDNNGQSYGNKATIGSEDYDRGVRLKGLWCLLDTQLNFCLDQQGTTCEFEYNWVITESSGYTIEECSKYGLQGWGMKRSDPLYNPIWNSVYPPLILESGAEVTLDDPSGPKYVCHVNKFTNGSLVEVSAYRNINGRKVMCILPSSYYTVTTEDSTVTVTGGETCLSITLTNELSFYDKEGWDSDTIYVSVDAGDKKFTDILSDLMTEANLSLEYATDLVTDLANLKMNFVIYNTVEILQLCQQLAYQAGCALLYRYDNTVKLQKLYEKDSVVVTLTDADIKLDSVELSHTDFSDIITKVLIDYKFKMSDDSKKYIISNNTDVYGLVESSDNFFAYSNLTNIKTFANFWLKRNSNSWKTAEFDIFLDKMECEIFDWVTVPVEIGATDGMVVGLNQNPETGLIHLKLWFPIKYNETESSSEAFATLTFDSTNPVDGLSQKDYKVDQLENGYTKSGSGHSQPEAGDTGVSGPDPRGMSLKILTITNISSTMVTGIIESNDITTSAHETTGGGGTELLEVNAYCLIAGGDTNSNLSSCVPLVHIGDKIPVFYCTSESNWYCVTLFQPSVNCNCL